MQNEYLASESRSRRMTLHNCSTKLSKPSGGMRRITDRQEAKFNQKILTLVRYLPSAGASIRCRRTRRLADDARGRGYSRCPCHQAVSSEISGILIVDVVRMRCVHGPHHVHTTDEIGAIISLDGIPNFDNRGESWYVYGLGPDRHRRDAYILYLLPAGAIEFTDK